VPDLILASASPRRALLLATAGFTFDVQRPNVVESIPLGEPAADSVLRLAGLKVAAVDRSTHQVVLGADTMVVLDGNQLGKPIDHDDAVHVLTLLSGRTHSVLTGWVAIGDAGERFGMAESRVTFKELSTDAIEAYIDDVRPFDKAGSYALQGENGRLIDRVDGSRANVMGLPLREVADALGDLGIDRSAPHG
jgi:septum formation protein